jgi:hypothetical protein
MYLFLWYKKKNAKKASNDVIKIKVGISVLSPTIKMRPIKFTLIANMRTNATSACLSGCLKPKLEYSR